MRTLMRNNFNSESKFRIALGCTKKTVMNETSQRELQDFESENYRSKKRNENEREKEDHLKRSTS